MIGMAGRFPDAPDVDAFWHNIAHGVESLRRFSDEELIAAGIDAELIRHPDYVKSGTLLEGIEEFDAGYFGFTPREAEVTDPQQRLLFETAVAALEHAGYGNASERRHVGVFVGVGESQYLFQHLIPQWSQVEPVRTSALHGNRPDFAATRLSYHLNLSGPAMSIGTACSTSLVAVHSACLSLRNDECEMALAGGASIAQLGPRGYLYQEGGITSPDGHCRTFDVDAKGTRSGSGAGIVVLKRLDRALADGDTILAVIKGSAVNNDGSDKVGYTAPSVFGQAQAIRDAQAFGGVAADSLQYVEAHGTATELGDPIEVKALTRAFGSATRKGYCAIGSVKANIGHLDSAAGIAGLIKTIKALVERKLPPSINFVSPNPKIDFEHGPFYVNTVLKDWPRDTLPRRAGVSSFGIGGTNAHVVLEETPDVRPSSPSTDIQLVVLSAKSEAALAEATSNLRAHLERNPDLSLAEVAYTLQIGRTSHGHRRAFTACSVAEAIDALRSDPPSAAIGQVSHGRPPAVVFMFPGQGSQYVGMGLGLYRSDPHFAGIVDTCAAILANGHAIDLHAVLFPGEDERDQARAARALERTEIAQPALFVVEYALASTLMHYGIRPQAMIGHSLGEYVAACLAGVFSLEDALRLVALRGQVMKAAPPGRMLAIPLSPANASPHLRAAGCDMAAVNSPRSCVASGSGEAIQALATALETMDVSTRELNTSHAFHSRSMAQVVDRFRETVHSVSLNRPQLPYVSNVTGNFIEPEEATDPEYWVRHMMGTVKFSDGIQVLADDPDGTSRIFLEVGPGMTLSSFARKHEKIEGRQAIPAMRHEHEEQDDVRRFLNAISRAWVTGASVHWSRLHGDLLRRRVPLPTYPFERRRYWIDKAVDTAHANPPSVRRCSAEWFYAPVWRQLPAEPTRAMPGKDASSSLWLVFDEGNGVGSAVRDGLIEQGFEVKTIRPAQAYRQIDDSTFGIVPFLEADYARLMHDIDAGAQRQINVVHLWSLMSFDDVPDAGARFEEAQRVGFDSLLLVSRVLDSIYPSSPTTVNLVTDRTVAVTGEEAIREDFGTALGLCKVIPQELTQLRTHHIDVDLGTRPMPASLAKRILAETDLPKRLPQVAFRGARRWGLEYERLDVDAQAAPPEVANANFVITGGFGRIGRRLAEEFARQKAAGIVLVRRAGFRGDISSEEMSRRIAAMEASGTRVIVCEADVSDLTAMSAVFDLAERELGPIEGVVHCAGKVHDSMQSLHDLTPASSRAHFVAKIAGTRVLHDVVAGRDIRFCMLMSSLSSVLGGLGFGAYAAANGFLDAFAHARRNAGDQRWKTVNWDGWIFQNDEQSQPTGVERAGMTPEEGMAAFTFASRLDHLVQAVHSTTDLKARVDQWLHLRHQPRKAKALYERPEIRSTYVAPASDTEKRLVSIWNELLGIEMVGIHDDFFELGGDSILITRLHAMIRSWIPDGANHLPLKALFEHPTVGAIAGLLNERDIARKHMTAMAELSRSAPVMEEGDI
ncbi:MAG: SDR family NAD(P)-dependent oxidoreductase [Luteibacter sp.]